jgi:hypothetical protein
VIRVHTIISGGQTGADRGALDAAADLGLSRGGMAPLGWRAEDGTIPLPYRYGMMQSGSEGYPVRTLANVEASSGTLIFSLGPLPHDSGSMLTGKLARRVGKPHRWFTLPVGRIGHDMVLEWLDQCRIEILNVAGPRESRERGIQHAVRSALVAILADEIGFGWTA